MTLSHSPNIVRDGLELYLDAANKKSFKEDKNILNLSGWIVGEGEISGFPLNGSTTENYRVISTDPWGYSNIVWEARPDAISGADGGWNGSTFTIDNTKMYRFSVWVRRTVTGNGSFYLGLNGYGSVSGVLHRDNISTNNTNPYFWAGGISAGDWRLVVGHVWPVNSGTGSMHEDSGQYTISGGKIAGITRDYVWRSETTSARHRSYLYYSTDVNTRQQWVYPRVDIIDGSEPSIDELLSNGPNTWYDLSGSSNNATLMGATFSNNAINFNGTTSNYGSVTHTILEPSGQTWGVWCSAIAGSGSDGYAYIMHINTASATGSSYMNIGLKPTNQLFAAMFGQYSIMDIGLTGSTSQYVFISLSWDGATQKAYLNGNLVYSQAATVTQGYSTTMGIGGYNLNGYRPIQGKIGSIYSYNRALTDNEIKQNFNALRGRYGI